MSEHWAAPGRTKVCYDSKEQAKRAARHRVAGGYEPIRVYRCDVCGAYHLGHTHAANRYASSEPDLRRIADSTAEANRLAAELWAAEHRDLTPDKPV